MRIHNPAVTNSQAYEEVARDTVSIEELIELYDKLRAAGAKNRRVVQNLESYQQEDTKLKTYYRSAIDYPPEGVIKESDELEALDKFVARKLRPLPVQELLVAAKGLGRGDFYYNKVVKKDPVLMFNILERLAYSENGRGAFIMCTMVNPFGADKKTAVPGAIHTLEFAQSVCAQPLRQE